MHAALFSSSQLLQVSYGPEHPFRLDRVADVLRLCFALDLLPLGRSPIESGEARRAELESFHAAEYLDALQRFDSLPPPERVVWGLGTQDNPVFPGLWRACLLTAGGSLAAARWIIEGLDRGESRRAFYPAGGLHHARRDRASGFCYVNDPVLAIQEFVASGRRVCYVDVDAHHGDGVQEAFYEDDRVLTISIHQDGRTIFPGTGFPNEIGRGRGTGFAVNVPILPGSTDPEYDTFREEILEPLVDAYRPDILVTQIGVDSLSHDPLAILDWTLAGLDRFLLWARGMGLPWLAVGGGGYRQWNVVRGWSLVWARMTERELPRRRPEADRAGRLPESWPVELWDEPPPRVACDPGVRRRHLVEVGSVLREMVFPRVHR